MNTKDLQNALNLLKCLDGASGNIGTQEVRCDAKSKDQGQIEIVVLQRGWVAVGEFYQQGDSCRLDNASVIRSWGTETGLGQIALNGPTPNTKLDESGTLRFHSMGVVTRIDCNQEKWS